MPTRRQVFKFSLIGGIAASTPQFAPIFAQNDESTPAPSETTTNGVLTNVLDQLPRADDGEFAPVLWGSGTLKDYESTDFFVLLHNNTQDDLILRQGWGRLLDAEGNVIQEMDKVSAAVPYSYSPDSYGFQRMSFDEVPTGVAAIELQMDMAPRSDATGAVENVTVTAVEPTNDLGSVDVHVRNDSDVPMNYANIQGIFFDEGMQIVGGGGNPVMSLGPGEESVLDLGFTLIWGEPTERFLFAAMGA